jgi:cell division protein FtsQ
VKRPERPSGQPAPPPAAKPVGKPVTKAAAKPTGAPRPEPRTPSAPRQPRERAVRPSEAARSSPSQRRAEHLQKRAERAESKRFTRRTRRRRVGWLIGLAVVATVVGFIAAAVFSPILALREIRVDGTTRIDPAVIQEAVSGQLGTPLALLDDGRIRRELSQFTSIRSYVTELVPPGTLVIHIVERSPLGLVPTASGFDVVDAAGVVLESSPTRPAGLPMLQIDDQGPEGTGFAAMAEVLVALPTDVLAQVDSITARTRDDVTLSLAGSDQRVVWGSAADSDRKARILAALLGQFAGAGPGEYDVSAPGSAVFRRD